jgi:septal ring factor EnvC (AmiA/AmiB activator)
MAFLKDKPGIGVKPGFMYWLILVCSIGFPRPAAPDTLKSAIDAQQKVQSEGARSQQTVEKLDEETQRLLDAYRSALSNLENLKDYNAQMERQVGDQKQEITRREAELGQIEETRRHIVPFMLRMLKIYEQLVGLDTPFLAEERQQRVEQLKKMMDRSDVALAEKYRRLLEAYRVEAEYGHTIEAYQGQLENGDAMRTVQFLRVGRVGLYYLSLDGREAAIWHPREKQWVVLDNSYREPLKQAILIAERQLPPDLMKLPLPAPEAIP